MTRLVTIFGGSGFLGRNIARRMAADGWRVRVATRRPNEALVVRTYGRVGQVQPVFANVRDLDSVRAVVAGSDAVINCTGVLNESGANTFDAVHVAGAGHVAQAAKEAGVGALVHISTIGASEDAPSAFSRSRAAGEAAVQAAFPGAVILRSSVIFGAEDSFFNKFAGMAVVSPALVIVGGNTRFQPVHVDDVAHAAVLAAESQVADGVYELGGPEVMTLRQLMERMLATIKRRRAIINLPFWLGRIVGGVLDIVQKVTLGLVTNTILTRDQVRSLSRDNVVSQGARGFEAFGIEPTAMGSILPEYLWRYRPSGQYATIKESARNLRA